MNSQHRELEQLLRRAADLQSKPKSPREGGAKKPPESEKSRKVPG